ncbi:MAG: hypothetical protein LBS27_11865 [Bifidobacteriaceae bacterium]|jgi:ParB family chromosome partitioning protein|nr:hypothetical protein [Bifidobacteriaceae bacterium]
MGDDHAAPQRLTVLAGRYAAIKKEVAAGLRARQEATRFGGPPLPDDGPSAAGKRDARRIAAERLGAGVSHTTLEKVLWLERVAVDMERRASLRREAMDAWDEVDSGAPVNWPHERIRTLVLIDDLERMIAEHPADSVVKMVAERELRLLRSRGVHGVTPAMKRRTRQALAGAERLDRDIDEAARRIGPGWRELEDYLKRRRAERKAVRDQEIRDRIKARAEAPLDGGANP